LVRKASIRAQNVVSKLNIQTEAEPSRIQVTVQSCESQLLRGVDQRGDRDIRRGRLRENIPRYQAFLEGVLACRFQRSEAAMGISAS
jgi:hypothetical protein